MHLAENKSNRTCNKPQMIISTPESPMRYMMHKSVAFCLARYSLLYSYSPEMIFLVANEKIEVCGSGLQGSIKVPLADRMQCKF